MSEYNICMPIFTQPWLYFTIKASWKSFIIVFITVILSYYICTDFSVDFGRVFTRLLPDLLGRLNVTTLYGIIAPSLNTIINNLVIDDSTRDLNLTQVVNNIVTALGDAAGGALAQNNTATQMCILNVIRSNLNQSDVDLVIQAIEDVRRAFTVLRRSANFFQQYVEDLQFRFPRNCVRRFVELNFCARCTQKTPPLCSNTCGALVRGCLSAYYSALSRQFDILWDVSRQVVMITNSTLRSLFSEERQLIDETTAVSICDTIWEKGPLTKYHSKK